MKEARHMLNQKVSEKVQREKNIIEHTTRKEYKLEEIVDGVTSANTYAETYVGKPVGNEAW
jgi:antitoxin component of MazEF toxin-antitoxin module